MQWQIRAIPRAGILTVGVLVLLGLAGASVPLRAQDAPPAASEGRARIAISMSCDAGGCNDVVPGLNDMLTTTLVRTHRFVVLERGGGLSDAAHEADLGESAYGNARKSVKKGGLEGAEVLVRAAITAFDPHASGGSGLAVPGGIPVLGGLHFGSSNAYIAMDMRLIDVRTGEVIDATRVAGKTSSFNVGGLGGAVLGKVSLGGSLDVYRNTPMEKAIAVLLDEAVHKLDARIPARYFRHQASE